MTTSFLERIVAATREELAARIAETPLEEMRARAAPPPLPFLSTAPHGGVLRLRHNGWDRPARLIAEIKRASPSKGLIAEHFDPVVQARAYEAGGAAAISVLTEPRFFQGSLDHLRAVRAAVRLPILRKDFFLDPYQIYEARAAGADAVLLLCSLLDDAQLRDLLALTHSLGMEALVEAHDAEEVRRAVAVGARIIGVNARDLRTFHVDPEVIRHLRPLVPQDRVFVAESGIADALGAARANAWGADALLVGEALMRADDPAAKARELATAPGGTIAAFFARAQRPFIKICGLSTPDQLRLVADLGADAYGLVFAPQAPAHRRLTSAQACEIVSALPRTTVAPTVEATEGGTEQPAQAGFAAQPLGADLSAGSPSADLSAGSPGADLSAGPLAVGVFVNEDPITIARLVEHVGLDAVQLSGDESPAQCAETAALANRPVLKALRPRTPADLAQLDAYVLAGAIPMLDTPRDGLYGGSGEPGDWALIREAAARWPIIQAGGLTPANVADALAATGARGVDVSSGVETDRAKDPAKIARFIQAARERTHHKEHKEHEEAR